MKIYLGIPLSKDYQKLRNEIMDNLSNKSGRHQSNNAMLAINILSDSLLNILVEDLIQEVNIKPFARTILGNLGALSRKTSKFALKKIVPKLSNRELEPLAEYLVSLEIKHLGKTYIAIELNNELRNLLEQCLESVKNHNERKARTELLTLMHGIFNLSLVVLMEKPLSLIKLGAISSKIVNLSTSTIKKAIPPALKKVTKDATQIELESFRNYIEEYIIRTIPNTQSSDDLEKFTNANI